ncbi:hypothetical protein OIU79_019028 [Salix purpurea]|uniref:Uncharacterized protein n=1 Tax=Salix purpurea TaxID=77065 RepID=A0A9Q0P081_SALPP|nr:hypothetical protein OIU79_019028 [Salix purpurea]
MDRRLYARKSTIDLWGMCPMESRAKSSQPFCWKPYCQEHTDHQMNRNLNFNLVENHLLMSSHHVSTGLSAQTYQNFSFGVSMVSMDPPTPLSLSLSHSP